MSQLIVTQKLMSFNDKFRITDEHDQIRYQVEEKLFTWGKIYNILDCYGKEVARIEEKVLSFRPTFHIIIRNEKIATVKKEITFFRSKYNIDGRDISCTGDFLSLNFTIHQKQQKIAEIRKELFKLRDTYYIDIPYDEHELMVLTLVLAIDICEHSSRNNN